MIHFLEQSDHRPELDLSLYTLIFESVLPKLTINNAFFHLTTGVHKLRSMRPTINQFQKEMQICVNWNKSSWQNIESKIGD